MFDELELEIDGLKVHLVRSGAGQGVSGLAGSARATAGGFDTKPETPSLAPLAGPAPPPAGCAAVKAPLLGTFYRAPKPGAQPFVEIGAKVGPDTIVGIIEVMKLMNTVRAGATGVVREIRARDGRLVEYGESRLLVETREPG